MPIFSFSVVWMLKKKNSHKTLWIFNKTRDHSRSRRKKILKQAGAMHNIRSQLKLLYPYCTFPFWYCMHSWDSFFYCYLMLCTTPACFNTFTTYYGPYSIFYVLIIFVSCHIILIPWLNYLLYRLTRQELIHLLWTRSLWLCCFGTYELTYALIVMIKWINLLSVLFL